MGKKLRRLVRGYCAKWCPICRGVQIFRCDSLNLTRHFLQLSWGSSEHQTYELVCLSCATPYSSASLPSNLAASKHVGLEQIIRQTLPDYPACYTEQFALEYQATQETTTLTPQQRLALIIEALQFLNYKAERYFYGSSIRKGNLFILFLSIILMAATQIVLELVLSLKPGILSFCLALPIAFVAAKYMERYRLRRFIRNQISPQIQRAIAHLLPTHEEIEEALTELRHQEQTLAYLLKPHHIKVP